nr:uncharacterized protein LOC103400212 [Malus domestica]
MNNQINVHCTSHPQISSPCGQNDDANQPNIAPLLLQSSDELCSFRVSLKWWALDHSSCFGKFLSYFTFIFLTVLVPILTSLFLKLPSGDPISFNKLVQLPESGLAAIGFITLSCFFRKYGLRQLLFLDSLRDDSGFVHHGYTRELNKVFKYLACILLPSFFIELTQKIIFFSTIQLSLPHISSSVPVNSIMFVLVLASWVYRTGVFLLVCVMFRLTCELQILRFKGLNKLLEGHESESCCIHMVSNFDKIFNISLFNKYPKANLVVTEQVRIRKQLWVTSHRYRFFIIGCMFTITVSQFGALLLVLASKAEKTFLNSGDLVVCSAVELSGRSAQRLIDAVETVTRSIHLKFPLHFLHRSLLHFKPVAYLSHNNGGITLYGFALDRGLLHTLFAFEFSLVLWVLSKVVVLS